MRMPQRLTLMLAAFGVAALAVAHPDALASPDASISLSTAYAEPSGTIIFSAVHGPSGVSELMTVSAAGGSPKPLRGRRFHGSMPAYSPDGRYLAYSRCADPNDPVGCKWGNSLMIARSDGWHPRVVVPRLSQGFLFHEWPPWSFDGRRLSFRNSDPSRPESPLYVVAESGGPSRKVRLAELEQWAPQEAGRAVEQQSRTVFGIAWFKARKTNRSAFIPQGWQPVWSPKRGEFAYLKGPSLLVFDTASRRSHVIARTGCSNPRRPAWSPDGRWVAYVSCTGKEPALQIVSPDGRDRRVLLRSVPLGTSASWRP
jgi:Tol biopolymer transport system component